MLRKKEVERTLALIRPDAFATNKDQIMERIEEAGFKIALSKVVTLTKAQAEEFYSEHAGQPYFEELTSGMADRPLLALGLAKEQAIDGWRDMLGPAELEVAKTEAPDSLRAQFAVDEVKFNQLHGSDTRENAQKELNFFFPMEQTVAVIKPEAMGTKDAIIDKIHEAGFRIAARKETEITKEIAEKFYEDQKDKDYYNDLVEHMCSGPTMFMVLSREGAVEGWRDVIGPTDPEKAKEAAPTSLRAQFGADVLKNAVHGASNKEEADKKIKEVFGDLEFSADGTAVPGAAAEADQPKAEEREQAEQQAAQEAQKADEPAQAEAGQAEETKAEESQPTEEAQSTEEAKPEESQPTEEAKPDAEPEAKPEEEAGEQKPDEEKPAEEEAKPAEGGEGEKAEEPKEAEQTAAE